MKSPIVWLVVPMAIFAAVHTYPIGLEDDLKDMVGYVIVGSERIEEFEGCDYGKHIQFDSNEFVICQEFGYDYEYFATATIFVRPRMIHDGFDCKLAVDDHLYDVDCSSYMKSKIYVYRMLAKDMEYAKYANHWLSMLGASNDCLRVRK